MKSREMNTGYSFYQSFNRCRTHLSNLHEKRNYTKSRCKRRVRAHYRNYSKLEDLNHSFSNSQPKRNFSEINSKFKNLSESLMNNHKSRISFVKDALKILESSYQRKYHPSIKYVPHNKREMSISYPFLPSK